MLTLVVPGLIWPRQTLADLTGGLALPALRRLLGRGRRRALPPADAAELAALALGGDTPLPAAALRQLTLTGAATSDLLLCLDPVSLRFEERSLVLDDPNLLRLDDGEADALSSAVAPCFADLGKLEILSPNQWQLVLRQPAPAFPALAPSVGRALSPLPADPAYAAWRHALNEAQMALHAHPVNRAREAAGRPLVNSLWPWGGGGLPTPGQAAHDRLYAADPVLRGLARLNGISAELPTPLPSLSGRHALVILETLDGPFRRGDGLEWREAFLAFEADWMVPTLQSLSAGRLRELRLIANGERGGVELRVARSDLWKFWRRPADPIAAFAETEFP